MENQPKKKPLKVGIVILAILLAINLAALAGILIYRQFVPAGPSSVVVPDNIITPETNSEEESKVSEEDSGLSGESLPSTPPANDLGERATAIYLHNRNAGDNTAFAAKNLFPGDRETKYFCVRVTYFDDVTVKYHPDIRPGYEKLAEVLGCKIVLLNTGETMYDGPMEKMPESLNHTLKTASETTTDLYYEITTYLDTSVGNEYQNKELIADFRWWVEEDENLAQPPQTGALGNPALWIGLLIGSLFLLILLFITRKKEEAYEQHR